MSSNAGAQLAETKLESIVNQTDVITSAQINVGSGPTSISLETFHRAIYVANEFSSTVSVIDPYTNTVIKNIAVGEGPSLIDSYGAFVYVTNSI